jgi:3-dehydroquinate synthetase
MWVNRTIPFEVPLPDGTYSHADAIARLQTCTDEAAELRVDAVVKHLERDRKNLRATIKDGHCVAIGIVVEQLVAAEQPVVDAEIVKEAPKRRGAPKGGWPRKG